MSSESEFSETVGGAGPNKKKKMELAWTHVKKK